VSDATTYHPRSNGRLALSAEDFSALGLTSTIGQVAVTVLPVLHGRMEFAWLVRTAIETLKPRAIAVELPESLWPLVRRAIARLPLLSVIQYRADAKRGRPMYLPIEPADALIEALRRAVELGIPTQLVDRDVDAYPQVRERLPDPAAAEQLGARVYLETTLTLVDGHTRAPEDDAREETMAFHLAQLAAAPSAREGPLLLVCGLHHARAVIRRLDELATDETTGPVPLRRVRRDDATLHHLSESSSREILSELPFINAAYERARGQIDPHDRAAPGERDPDPPRGPLAAVLDLFTHAKRAATPAPAPTSPSPSPRDPYRGVSEPATPSVMSGRVGLLHALCTAARRRYEHATGNTLRPGALLGLLRYACRYALTERALVPDLYQLAIAARGFVDDNYAHEVWDAATTYPWQTTRPEITPIELSLRDLHEHVRTIRFRPLTMQRRRRLMKIVRPRPRERRPGDWATRFKGEGICSFPPEDVALEHYGAYLRKRTVRTLSAEQTRSSPFASSLLDGIDLRETVRNWHEGQIYVQERQLIRGKPGDVVVVFEDEPLPSHDEDHDDDPRFPWLMTWQGEHDEEGDMALFSTDPFSRIVGPGIGRALYGGFVLHRPPGTMFAIWEDSYYQSARTKAEVLILAALDHTTERFIVYVAPAPPRQGIRQIAHRLGKKIIYTPLGQLSPVALKRLRMFHVLSDHETRAIASTYIDPA
jgi:hypothetical protein